MACAAWVLVDVDKIEVVVEVLVDVAVRARERVHRRPLTVVIVSAGVAMQDRES